MARTPFDIPEQMRQAADTSVVQARRAFDSFMEATHQAMARAEGSAKSMQADAADLNRQALAYVEENLAASFDLAAKLARARTVEEITALQQEFVKNRLAAAAEQGRNLGTMAGRSAAEAATKTRG